MCRRRSNHKNIHFQCRFNFSPIFFFDALVFLVRTFFVVTINDNSFLKISLDLECPIPCTIGKNVTLNLDLLVRWSPYSCKPAT